MPPARPEGSGRPARPGRRSRRIPGDPGFGGKLRFALGFRLPLSSLPQLSDEALVDKMKTNLAADGYKFRALVDTVVLSPQFLNRRITDMPAQAPAPENRDRRAGISWSAGKS